MTLLIMLLSALNLSYADEPTVEIPFEKYELSNGLDVILSPDHSTPVVYVSVWYHVGSKDETKGLTGFAHLFEHLMFQGSLSHNDEYFGPLQEVGASINGTTSFDRTNYYEYLPSQHLPRALFMESDRMGYLLEVLSQEKLDNQRDVVRNERRQRYENPPYGDVWGILGENMYPEGHPYHHLPIGSHEDLQAASLQTVKDFFTKWYAPNNASLVVAGDFDITKTKAMIEEYFGPIQRGDDPTRGEVTAATLSETKVVQRFDDVPERKLWLVWHSPSLYQPGDAELDLFSSVFGSGKDSRLYKHLVREKKVAKSVAAYQMSESWGLATIQATASEGKPQTSWSPKLNMYSKTCWATRLPQRKRSRPLKPTMNLISTSPRPPFRARAKHCKTTTCIAGHLILFSRTLTGISTPLCPLYATRPSQS